MQSNEWRRNIEPLADASDAGAMIDFRESEV